MTTFKADALSGARSAQKMRRRRGTVHCTRGSTSFQPSMSTCTTVRRGRTSLGMTKYGDRLTAARHGI
jgi:hypothetical protein